MCQGAFRCWEPTADKHLCFVRMESICFGETGQIVNKDYVKYKACQMVINAGKNKKGVKRLGESQCEG